MKKLILLLLVILSSCVKVTHSDKMIEYCKVISTNYVSEKDEYKYHYGYSVLKGRICWHFGNVHEDEKYEVKIKFFDDTLNYNDKKLYYRDSVKITYVKVYRDSVFYKNMIESVE